MKVTLGDERTQTAWVEHNALQGDLLKEMRAIVQSLDEQDKQNSK